MTDIPLAKPATDLRITGVVGAAHFTSHFYQLVLPPLFPLMRESLAVNYTELGLLMSMFFAGSGRGRWHRTCRRGCGSPP